jgi:glycerol-3-phosphate dehydrogenase
MPTVPTAPTTPTAAPLPAAGPHRQAAVGRLASDSFDVLVVGGGITGAGVALAAAERGMSVALLEAEDFACGTSSRSSKLIHGGLRYLAMGDVGLVRDTARERTAVHAMAPHLAEPCWMVVPARSRAGALKLRAAIAAYEKLGAVAAADRHRNWEADDLAVEEPALRRDLFPHACAYREYRTDDARLVLAVLRAAVRAGAVVLNRARVVAVAAGGAGRVERVTARCDGAGEDREVRTRTVVNAAGPWVEDVARLEVAGGPARLHLSKGVHVVVPADQLPVRNLLVLSAADGRSVFTVPRGDVVYVGTTDTSFTGGPADRAEPGVDRADVDYLLDPLGRALDVEPLVARDVVAAWAGLRPLVAPPPGAPAAPPSELSRRDEVWIGEAGMITVAGGKLTGFRRMAETVLDHVGRALGSGLPPAAPSAPLPGGELGADLSVTEAELVRRHGVTPAVAARLVRLYGSESSEVLDLGAEPLVPGGHVVAGELAWAVDVEAAATVADVIDRRWRAAAFLPGERDGLVAPVAAGLAARLGWDDRRRAAEEDDVRRRFRSELDFVAAP